MSRDESELVYSTDAAERSRLKQAGTAAKPGAKAGKAPQTVTVACSRKGRGGKTVTVVAGLRHCPAELERLAKVLRTACGSGGSVKDGEILIQGDHRDKVAATLRADAEKRDRLLLVKRKQ